MENAPDVQPATRAAWRAWLRRNHASQSGAWVITFKKHTGRQSPGYDDLVEEALCFGWIDSRPQALDDERTKLYFSPRKAGSGWAATNKARVQRLASAGLLEPAGLAAIERAKADGSWTKLDGSESLEIPDDLAAAFLGYPTSAERFAAFPPGARKAILQWIAQAKRPTTRAARIDETARLAKDGIRANQWEKRD